MSITPREMTLLASSSSGPLGQRIFMWSVAIACVLMFTLPGILVGVWWISAIGAAVLGVIWFVARLLASSIGKNFDLPRARLRAAGLPATQLDDLLVEGLKDGAEGVKLAAAYLELRPQLDGHSIAVRWHNDSFYFYLTNLSLRWGGWPGLRDGASREEIETRIALMKRCVDLFSARLG
jgi:hypothetical protein